MLRGFDDRKQAIAGGVLPIGTVLGVLELTARAELPWVVPLFLLLASPLFAAAGLSVAGIRFGTFQTPSWLPVGTRRMFGDDIPDRYHEEFSHDARRGDCRGDPRSDGRRGRDDRPSART